MMPITPTEGGQYRFKYITDESQFYIGVFHSYSVSNCSYHVDLYIEAFTPVNEIPPDFVSLLGLPDVKRHDELTRIGVRVIDIIILDRIYICKNSMFQQRRVQWRLGMRNLYRISDDEADGHLWFNGYSEIEDSYINEEHDYLNFKMVLVKVMKSSLLLLHLMKCNF